MLHAITQLFPVCFCMCENMPKKKTYYKAIRSVTTSNQWKQKLNNSNKHARPIILQPSSTKFDANSFSNAL